MNVLEAIFGAVSMLLVAAVMVAAVLSPIIGLVLVRCLRGKRADRRRMQNLCIKCEYDLRGSEGRCPECGTEFSE